VRLFLHGLQEQRVLPIRQHLPDAHHLRQRVLGKQLLLQLPDLRPMPRQLEQRPSLPRHDLPLRHVAVPAAKNPSGTLPEPIPANPSGTLPEPIPAAA
jgi:hypothetical protein